MATTETIIIEIVAKNTELAATEKDIKKVSASLKELRKDEVANAEAIRAQEAELRILNKELAANKRATDAAIVSETAQKDTLKQLKAQYQVNIAALNKMTADEIKNTKAGKDLVAENLRINTTLKEVEASYGQNARNVGNYNEAIKPLIANLNRLEGEMAELVLQGKGTGAEFEKLAAESRLVKNSINEVNASVKGVTAESKSLKQSLREITQELQKLELQGQGNSEEFRNLSAEAGRIKDTIGDVNNTIKALASDTSLIDGVATGISGVAGAFSAAQGAAALFGDENEDLQKTMVKIQATMAIANGVQQVANALQKDSAAMVALNTARTQAATAAQAIYTAVVGGTTGVLKALRIALAATGIGLAIVAIGFLIAKIVEWTEKTDDQAKSEAALKMQLEANIKVYEDTKKQIELVNDQKDLANKRNIDLAKSSGATAKAIAELENKAYEDQIKGLQNLRNRTAAAYVQLSKFPAQYVTDLLASNEKIIDAQKNVPFVISKDQVEQAQKLLLDAIDFNNRIADLETKIKTERNEKLLKAQEEFKKKTLDALSALNTLENRILSDNYDFRVKQLTDTYTKENKIIDDAYKLGLVNEAEFLVRKLALNEEYRLKLRGILTQEAQDQKDLNAELLENERLTKDAQLLIQQEGEAKSLENFTKAAADRLAVSDAEAKQIEENAKVYTDIFTQQADLINKAFTESITSSGIDLKRFAKQALAITIDTIEKIVLVRQSAAIAEATAASLSSVQSVATGGVAGVIQAAYLTGLIKAAFAVFKATVIGSFEKGGIIPKAADGMLVGNRHAQGGIKIGTPSGMIEAEGGEVIINRKSVSMYKPLLSAINEAGGGVKFADGGQIYTPPVSQEFNILADMFKTMPQPVVSVVDIIDVTQKVGRVKATATL
jgi:hypothetical protein